VPYIRLGNSKLKLLCILFLLFYVWLIFLIFARQAFLLCCRAFQSCVILMARSAQKDTCCKHGADCVSSASTYKIYGCFITLKTTEAHTEQLCHIMMPVFVIVLPYYYDSWHMQHLKNDLQHVEGTLSLDITTTTSSLSLMN